jgi:hypothetical protein
VITKIIGMYEPIPVDGGPYPGTYRMDVETYYYMTPEEHRQYMTGEVELRTVLAPRIETTETSAGTAERNVT